MHRRVKKPISLNRQNKVLFSWTGKKQRGLPRLGHKEPWSFHMCHLKSLIQLSAELNMLYGIHPLIGKINGRALNILFFLHKKIWYFKGWSFEKKKNIDVKFFFKIPNEIIICNSNLFQVSLGDLETKISWFLVMLQPSFLTRCVCRMKCADWKLWIMASSFL